VERASSEFLGMRENVCLSGVARQELLESCLVQVCFADAVLCGDSVGAEEGTVEGHALERHFGEGPDEALAEVSECPAQTLDMD
jgi:hypothetical protein